MFFTISFAIFCHDSQYLLRSYCRYQWLSHSLPQQNFLQLFFSFRKVLDYPTPLISWLINFKHKTLNFRLKIYLTVMTNNNRTTAIIQLIERQQYFNNIFFDISANSSEMITKSSTILFMYLHFFRYSKILQSPSQLHAHALGFQA